MLPSNLSCHTLSLGDIIIDGGNTHFPIPIAELPMSKAKDYFTSAPRFRWRGRGSAWPFNNAGWFGKSLEHVRPVFQTISAKVEDGSPCCDWVGENGAGHFVKMVHNGIEYGDMQLICEAIRMMKDLLSLTTDEMHEVFADWNNGELDSYLIEITRDILGYKEEGKPLVEKILDTAGQKGTGNGPG
jgi:6-phosphogluconate dehydrogenase